MTGPSRRGPAGASGQGRRPAARPGQNASTAATRMATVRRLRATCSGSTVEADLVDEIGGGLALLGDLGERQLVGRDRAEQLHRVGFGDGGVDRKLEVAVGIEGLRLLAEHI